MTPLQLRAWRARLEMTQPQAAKALSVPVGTYRQWEQGRRTMSNVIELATKWVEGELRISDDVA